MSLFPLPRLRPELDAQPVGDERVVYDPRDDSVHVLGPAASRVWDGLADGCDPEALRARLASAGEPGVEGSVEELERILAELAAAGLFADEPRPAQSDPEPPAPVQPAIAALPHDGGGHGAPPESPADAVRSAVRQLAAGDLASAERTLRAALAASPHDPALLGNLASVLFLAGGSDEPAALFERAVGLAPNRPELWSNLGNLRRRQGRDEDAAACYERALELVSDHFDATCNLAALRAAQKRGAEAVALWRRAAAREPRAAAPVVALARFHSERGDHESAESVLREALESSPESGELWNALGIVLAQGERRDEAMECFERAAEARPPFPAAARNLLAVTAAAGRWSDVETHATRFAALSPDFAEAHRFAARARVATGRKQEAIAGLRDGLSRPAIALACADELVGIHENARDRAEALLVYASIVRRFGEDEIARWPRLAIVQRRAAEWRGRDAPAHG